MKACYSLSSSFSKEPTVLTIGAFDGIHRGHEQLIRSVVTAARAKRYRSVLVTFSPPPTVVLGRATPFYITTNEEKLAALQSLGLDMVVILEFTPEVACLRASEFVDRLIQQLDMRELWIGYDFALGARREGDAAFLQSLSGTRGFGFHSIPPVLLEGLPVSSTRIRNALRQGNIPEANACLGRPFRLAAKVTSRAPRSKWACRVDVTAMISQEHALPAAGSYACCAQIQSSGKMYKALARIGAPDGLAANHRTVYVQLRDGDAVIGHLLTLDFLHAENVEQALSFQVAPVLSAAQDM